MTIRILRPISFAVLAAALLLGSTACSSSPAPSKEAPSAETSAPKASAGEAPASGNRSGVITLAEASFQAFNGEARWEDDTLVVALDGDANEELDASFACGILQEFLEDGEQARLEFPNGAVDCAAV